MGKCLVELDRTPYVRPSASKYCASSHGREFCRLLGGLYGLKQSNVAFYRDLATTMESLGFLSTASDPCVFVAHSADPLRRCVVLIHVDRRRLRYGLGRIRPRAPHGRPHEALRPDHPRQDGNKPRWLVSSPQARLAHVHHVRLYRGPQGALRPPAAVAPWAADRPQTRPP
jgi:hypothetical protein